MSLKSISIFLLLVGSLVAEKPVSFQNFRVFSVNVTNEQQLEGLRQFEESAVDGIDFWKSSNHIGGRSDVMVAPHQLATFEQVLQNLELQSHVMVDNVQKLIDSQQPNTRVSGLDWTSYQTLDSIYEWLDEQLAAYPTVLTGLTVGTSYENRTIRAVRLSHKVGNPIIFIESTIHAREWITAATATWLLNELLTSTNPEVQDLAQNIDWVIVPVFNVDGFVYTHTTNRMWRKTRYPHGRLCYGADANRNFDHMWMTIGASANLCLDTFAGPTAFSEVESRALADFIASFSGQISAYISFHSYSQLFMFPWGYTVEPVYNYDVQDAIAKKTQEALAARYGTEYSIGPSSVAIYHTSGSTVDWVFATQNVSLAYTIEFRDKGAFGFLLPTNQIIPNGEETLDGLIAFVKEARVQNAL